MTSDAAADGDNVLLVIEAGPAFPTLPKTRFHVTPSDRTVSPGQVISIKVRGPGVDRWNGGVDSYLERRNGDGRWEQIYMLHWFGQGDTPTIREPGSGIEEPLVQATPFDGSSRRCRRASTESLVDSRSRPATRRRTSSSQHPSR